MARKSAVLLKSTPVKLDTISKSFLAAIDKQKPVEGCEEQWERYVTAARASEEAQARYDAIFKQCEKEGGASSCKSWPAFIVVEKEYERLLSAAFGALDMYLFAVKHKDDGILVPEAELRAIIIDSLSDKLDEIAFSVNYGVLGSNVAIQLRKDTLEGPSGEPLFCEDCA